MKLKRCLISVVISLSILLSGINIPAKAELNLVNGYYEITCEEDLRLIKDLDAKYKIVNNLKIENPVSLGSLTAPFSGELTGALGGDFKSKPTITVLCDGNYGGLVSYLKGGIIKNIIIDGDITTSQNTFGSFAAIAKSGKITGCVNKADIVCNYNGKKKVYVGGIVGYTDAPAEVQIADCENYGKINCTSSSDGSVGGIGGRLSFSNIKGSIKDCKNEGEIISTLEYTGGIAGELITFNKAELCANKGKITSENKNGYAGGISGCLNGGLEKSFNIADIECENISGGVAGLVKTDNNSCISKCYNNGKVANGGGIAGIAKGKKNGEISLSYNSGKAKNEVAMQNNFAIKDTYVLSETESNTGSVTALTEENFKNLSSFGSFSKEEWGMDEEMNYPYPQIKGHKYGTLKFEYSKITNGCLYFEAEDGIALANEAVVKTDKNASGGKYISFPNSHTEISVNQPVIQEPAISFKFELDKKTDVTVWMRVRVQSTSEDNMFLGINEQYQILYLTVEDDLYWKKVKKITLEPGVHSLELHPRDYTSIDKVLITDAGYFIPSGMGGSPDDEVKQLISHEGPTFKPVKGHPRVYITKERIEGIKNNLTASQNAKAYEKHLKYLSDATDGTLPEPAATGNNFNSTVLEIIESRAFDYVINGNEESGLSAISSMKNYVSTMTMDDTLYWGYYSYAGEAIHKLAMVYDWCYPLLTDGDKDFLHRMFVALAQGTEIGWPPVEQPLSSGHGAETQLMRDMLAAGIAMYDEYPYIYNNVAGRFFDEAVEYRKELISKANFHPEGDHYVQVRYGAELGAVLLFDALGIPNVFGEEHGTIPYWMIYARRPDGSTLRSGDSMHDSHPIGEFYDSYYELMFLASNYYNDPYIKNEAMRESINLEPETPYANQSLTPVEILIFNNPKLEGRSLKELPLTRYFPSPQSGMVARTDWSDGIDSPAVVAEMKISEFSVWSHSHVDAGAFQIYYKGNLAADTGYYGTNVGTGSDTDNMGRTYAGSVHYHNYQRRTIAHNAMLVYDPEEKFEAWGTPLANDGGQRNVLYQPTGSYDDFLKDYDTRWKTGETLGYEFGPDPVNPDYTYLKGDISYAYSNKVSGYERSFMFLNLFDEEVPAAMLVFDRVKSSNPAFKKTWLLHGREEPKINGNHVEMSDTFDGHNGKIVLDTLLPENPSIEKVGGPGKDFFVDGVNWNGLGADGGSNESTDGWRVEVSPSTPRSEDYFLNVMQVSDADSTKEPLKVTGIYEDTHTGAIIADRIVLFGNEKDRVNKDVSFSFEQSGKYKIAVADLYEGTWTVYKNNEKQTDVVVTKDGGIAYFEGESGSYILKRTGDNAAREEITKEVIPANDIYLLDNDKFIYSNIIIKNGISIIPSDELAKILYISSDGESSDSCTFSGYGKKLTVKKGSLTAGGTENITLNAAPEIINGKLYVPLRAVAEYFYREVSYNKYPPSISLSSKASLPEEGYVSIIDCSWKANLETTNGYMSYDNNIATSWATAAAAGTGECEITYDFGTSQSIAGITASFSRSNARSFKFDIFASEDGVNWTKIISDGQTEITEDVNPYQNINFTAPVNAKYIKYLGKGNSSNNANNILEIKFRKGN